MKGLLKTAVLLVIFCATAMACGGVVERMHWIIREVMVAELVIRAIKKNRNNHLLLILLLSTNSIKVSR